MQLYSISFIPCEILMEINYIQSCLFYTLPFKPKLILEADLGKIHKLFQFVKVFLSI